MLKFPCDLESTVRLQSVIAIHSAHTLPVMRPGARRARVHAGNQAEAVELNEGIFESGIERWHIQVWWSEPAAADVPRPPQWRPPGTTAAVRARREHTARLLRDVQDALRAIRKDRLAVTFRGVATLAGVSRTFLYVNIDARRLVESAIATTDKQRTTSRGEKDHEIEASWRERALNAEDALTAANREIVSQRQRIADLFGQAGTWSRQAPRRVCNGSRPKNTSLKQRVRQLDDERQGLDERLEAARSNNRFLDRRLAALEVEVLERNSLEGA